jgi:hypothetical protein
VGACHGKLEQGKLVLEQKPLNYELLCLLCCSAFIKMLMHTKSGAAEISSSSATPCAGGSCSSTCLISNVTKFTKFTK